MTNNRPIIIGVTGGSGSGKTSISRAILDQFPNHSIMMLEHDSYYKNQDHLVFEERLNTNYDHPFAFDTDLLIEHLEQLRRFETIEKPVYDYVRHTRSAEVILQEPKEVIILEGILILEDERLRNLMDIKIYVETDDDIRIIRRIKRDMEERGRSLQSVIDQYRATVRPMFLQFIEPSKQYADIVIPRGGKNRIAINMLKAQILHLLNQK